jgi:hypothetical protein
VAFWILDVEGTGRRADDGLSRHACSRRAELQTMLNSIEITP